MQRLIPPTKILNVELHSSHAIPHHSTPCYSTWITFDRYKIHYLISATKPLTVSHAMTRDVWMTVHPKCLLTSGVGWNGFQWGRQVGLNSHLSACQCETWWDFRLSQRELWIWVVWDVLWRLVETGRRFRDTASVNTVRLHDISHKTVIFSNGSVDTSMRVILIEFIIISCTKKKELKTEH
jgi:hypothetical protein